MTVRRIEIVGLHLDAPERTSQGFLRVPGLISRTGIQTYRTQDGAEHRELRLPEEVFDAAALQSFSLAPLTLGHPPEPVTSENCDAYEVGTVGELVEQKADKVSATILVRHKDAIAAVERGVRQLSCGYSCDLEEKPGEWNGQRYDAIQRNIRGNHVAIVPVGRAGPEVRLKLDSHDAVQIASTDADGGSTVKTIKINGVEFKVDEALAVALTLAAGEVFKADADNALSKMQGNHPSSPSTMMTTEKGKTGGEQGNVPPNPPGTGQPGGAKCDVQTGGEQQRCGAVLQCPVHGATPKKDADEIEKQKARADVAEAALVKAKADHKDATDPKKVAELVRVRVAIEKQAAEILDSDVKLDSMTEGEIKRAVVAKLSPEVKLDGKPESYVEAAYDLVVDGSMRRAPARAPRTVPHGAAAGPAANADAADKVTDPREKLMAQNREAHKAPLQAHKADPQASKK